jgi:hypothetical protein
MAGLGVLTADSTDETDYADTPAKAGWLSSQLFLKSFYKTKKAALLGRLSLSLRINRKSLGSQLAVGKRICAIRFIR